MRFKWQEPRAGCSIQSLSRDSVHTPTLPGCATFFFFFDYAEVRSTDTILVCSSNKDYILNGTLCAMALRRYAVDGKLYAGLVRRALSSVGTFSQRRRSHRMPAELITDVLHLRFQKNCAMAVTSFE